MTFETHPFIFPIILSVSSLLQTLQDLLRAGDKKARFPSGLWRAAELAGALHAVLADSVDSHQVCLVGESWLIVHSVS